jgi:outer membrane protein W
MKKLLGFVSVLLLGLLLNSGTAFSAGLAPIDKGNFIVRGQASFSSWGGDLYEDSGGDRTTKISLTPGVDYFVMKGLAVGGALMYDRTSNDDYTDSTFGIGPEITYFFDIGKNGKGAFYPYIGAALFYEYYKSKIETSDVNYDEDGSGYSITVGPGICYMLTDAVGLNAMINYQYDSIKLEDTTSGNKITLALGLTVFLR